MALKYSQIADGEQKLCRFRSVLLRIVVLVMTAPRLASFERQQLWRILLCDICKLLLYRATLRLAFPCWTFLAAVRAKEVGGWPSIR